MAGRTTRIKVSREQLLGKLRAEREGIVARHKKASEKWEADKAAWVEKLISETEAFLTTLRSDPDRALKRVDSYYRSGNGRGTEVHFGNVSYPEKPSASASTGKLDRHIRVLEISEDDTISVGADDEYVNYL